MASYVIDVTDRVTGQRRSYVHEAEWDEFQPLDENGTLFLWSEGNFACDCNIGQVVFGLRDIPCGESRFVLHGITLPNGVWYSCHDKVQPPQGVAQ